VVGDRAGNSGRVGEVLPLPFQGEAFVDARGEGRSMRVSWHPDADILVLSLWAGGLCRGTFRLRADEVPELVRALVDGVVERGSPAAGSPARSYGPPPVTLDRPQAPRPKPVAGPED